MINDSRHAFLIMAHTEPQLLRILLKTLDHERVDIFVHTDKKSCCQFDEFLLKESKVKLIDPIEVYWGGDSQIKCQLKLLEEAVSGEYDRYHLLSGVDLPIKTMDFVLDYFDKYEGYEFIDKTRVIDFNDSVLDRIRFYYPYQNMIGTNVNSDLAIKQNNSILFQK